MAPVQRGVVLQLLTIAYLPLSTGSFLGFGGYGAAFDGRVGPWDANSTEFMSYVAASNATGVFRIPGYDVSEPFPGSPIDGWTISLTALDMSQGARMMCSDDVCTSDGMIGASMTIQAPASLLKTNPEDDRTTKIVDADPSWGMCVWDFSSPNQLQKDRYNNKGNKPLAADGSCKGFLSDACIAALEEATKSAYSAADSPSESRARYGLLTTCSRLSVPDECGEHGPGNAGFSVPSYGGVPVKYLNGSVTSVDGWEFDKDRGTLYNSTKDLQEFWDSMVANYWVVVAAMVNATADPDVFTYERTEPLSRVHCIAPNGQGTGKAFTFSGVVPANAQNFQKRGEGGEGGSGNGAGTGDGDGGSGAGMMVSPAKWQVGAMLAASLALGSWLW